MDIDLYFSFDDYFGRPTIEVLVDDQSLFIGEVEPHLQLQVQNLSNGDHVLSIRHFGKMPEHHGHGHDRHVHLDRVLFDHTDLNQLVWARLTHRGKFYPDYDKDYAQNQDLPEFIMPNHYFGHNGTWRLEFKSPALLWVIQEQNPSGMHLEDTIFSTTQDSVNYVKDFFKF